MKMLQKSAVMRGTDNMVIKEIPVPQIKDKEVLVSLEYVGICGSDVHYYHNGCCGAYKVDLSEDFMLGHECAGTIVEVGKDVEILKSEIALLWNRELLVVNANSVNQDIIIYVQMLYFLQLLQFRDVMKNLSLFQKICVLNFQKMYLQKKVH